MISLLKRPNDVWLRIWLLLFVIIMSGLNAILIPTMSPFVAELEVVVATVVIILVAGLLWLWLKRDDCRCWDDIEAGKRVPVAKNIDCMEERYPNAAERKIAQSKMDADPEWKPVDQGKAWGYGGTDD